MIRKAAAIAIAVVLLAGAALWIFNGTLSQIARRRIIHGLEQSFASQVEIKALDVRVFPRFQATGSDVILRFRGRRDLPPLLSIRRLSADAGWLTLLSGHVPQVRLEGLEIQVPPKDERPPEEKKPASPKFSGVGGFVIDEIVADGTILKTLPNDPSKEPLVWEIRKLRLTGASASSPMSFRATLRNAKPPGDIESTGKFGPWRTEEPGDTPVQGSYSFQNADLSVFPGISGKLSSQGTYRGVLDRIEAQGQTDTPDFATKVGGNPVHLTTEFQAVVDGTDGNTFLQPVIARFGGTSAIARGGIVGMPGEKGKTVSLDVTVDDGRLEDMLRLGMKGPTPTMTGAVKFHAKLVIPPGDVEVTQKMKFEGTFQVASAHFSQLNIQERVNKLSHGGRGEPEAPPTDTVASDFGGAFRLDRGVMTLRDLTFRVPGVRIALSGRYQLADEQIEFHGTAELEAKLSQATTGFKSFVLKAVDPFFAKKTAGAEIPIKITGTSGKPSFGLDLAARR